MNIHTKVHTIFMLIGSTECGKTTFAQKVLIPQLKFEDASKHVKSNVQYLSSDAIRQEVLGYDYDKYDQVMLEASDQAFRLLFEKLKMVTSFPINAEFVVVDTTGLGEDFRAKVRDIAYENNYNVEVILFDYRKREDYYASERSKKLITNHITRLKKEVLGSLAREGYAQVHRVRAKDFYSVEEKRANPDYAVVIDNLDAYMDTILPQDHHYMIVGDVHECLDDLQGLLLNSGYRIEAGKLITTDKTKDTQIVLVGDWIDKGKRTRETIEFLYDNQEHLRLVLGNHENFVYKYTKGEISGVNQDVLQSYFDSTQVLQQDDELMGKFRALVEMAKPYYRYNGQRGSSFYVTHAPCRNKYIGKLDVNSARHQRNFRIDREASLEEQLQFLEQEAVSNHPFHVFGHVAAKSAFRIKNKLHIDTGSAHGNALTSVTITYRPFLKSQRAQHTAVAEELPTLFQVGKKVSVQELGEDEIRRLHYCSRHKVNFISGTMSPADKEEETGELESLKRGLDYYASRGVQQVVLQPKYMGSRCNIYLQRELDQCFAVSRNGYKIKQVDLREIYAGLLDKFGSYMERNRIAMLILDGELLPWNALGEGLIQRQFKPIEMALESEFAFLQEHSYEQALGTLVADYQASDFEKDQYHMAKPALNEKYGTQLYQNYKHVHDVMKTSVPLSEHVQAYEVYKKQLELYAQAGTMEYKPFALLKIVYESGEEQLPAGSTSEMYGFLSDDTYLLLDLSQADSYAQAKAFFSELTMEKHMEGVVIKPEHPTEKAVPYMKVRNPEYLSIVYGYDYRFPYKYSKLLKQKNVTQKLRTSMNEHRLGLRMLAIKYDEIAPTNEAYKTAAANLLFETVKEKELDPRL